MCLESHIEALKKKHQTLSDAVEDAERHPSTCPLAIRDMKKQKLKLKERIDRFSRRLTPADVHAAKAQLRVAATGGRRISDDVRADLEAIASAA
ncbi:YdcH family protein [Candidatus Kaiserbacteria bacterium]|nr:YdcH family protein [Candidatus Kaiserbacteria bacterium]